jgi:hypothetical protein
MKKMPYMVFFLLFMSSGFALTEIHASGDGRNTIISGQLTDSQGNPLAGVEVDIYCSEVMVRTKTTGADGKFSYESAREECDPPNEVYFIARYNGNEYKSPKVAVEYRPQYQTDKAALAAFGVPEFSATTALVASVLVGAGILFLRR